tara:strand:- start:36627 stop:37886 length:1260 start_codon:yes stop_codon:yes gene_type:complete
VNKSYNRASDEALFLLYVGSGESCSASQVAGYLSGLGIKITHTSVLDICPDLVAHARILLLGDLVLEESLSETKVWDILTEAPEESLVIVVTSKVLTFAQRLDLSRLGNVRVFGVGDTKRIRDSIRDWERHQSMNGYRVLLVEDSRTDAYLASKYMEKVGIDVRHINRTDKVLAEIEAFGPDLIISDLNMPGCGGDDMARVIRQDVDATLPIIFLSAESNSSKQLLALAAGADGFIRKPLTEQPFIQAIKSSMRRSVELENRMRKDYLTGLLNRAQFDACMLRIATRDDVAALAILDIDHFKLVNDRHGHPVGDKVICALAEIMEDGVRSSDFVGRVGGEEFAVLMPDCSVENARVVMERLRCRFESHQFSNADGDSFFCTMSVGIAALSRNALKSFKAADGALYESKEKGRNRITIRP